MPSAPALHAKNDLLKLVGTENDDTYSFIHIEVSDWQKERKKETEREKRQKRIQKGTIIEAKFSHFYLSSYFSLFDSRKTSVDQKN